MPRTAFAFALLGSIYLTFTPVTAAMVASSVTAANGVVVHVQSDDFANRYEYTAPLVKLDSDNYSFFLVAAIKQKGVNPDVFITGTLFYSGDWRYYDSAVFRGGAPAHYLPTDRKVVGCSGGCSFQEGFQINLTAKDISDHTANGLLEVEIRARSSDSVQLNIPVSYIDAVKQVSSQRN